VTRTSSLAPRAVVVTRPSEYELLLATHGTRAQAAFFLKTRGQDLGPAQARHADLQRSLALVLASIPAEWRRARVGRARLDRFLFAPDDVVLAVGQDGLVANLAKYLDDQVVIGINPDPSEYEGILVPHAAQATASLLDAAGSPHPPCEVRTMVAAKLDDGQTLVALNELFIGHRSHQSARYRLRWNGGDERQSSSGVLVATGTGSTGWAHSVRRQRRCDLHLPKPTAPELVFFVREAWPSVATGTRLTEGHLRCVQAESPYIGISPGSTICPRGHDAACG
jgi:NAD kinase